jgi:hypothetical protein
MHPAIKARPSVGPAVSADCVNKLSKFTSNSGLRDTVAFPWELAMPDITMTISDDDHRLLSEQYKKMSIDWLQSRPASMPPRFEQWVADQVVLSARRAAMGKREAEEMQAIDAIEKLVTGMQRHGFGLANLSRHGDPGAAVEQLAQATANSLGLSPHGAKRLQELIGYYAKTARDIADMAHVGMTNRAYGALHESYRELAERTLKALDHLGEQQALGRVEGAVAILVSMRVMSREAAKEKTEAFRRQARGEHE